PSFRQGVRLAVEILERFDTYPDLLRTLHRFLQCLRPAMLTTFYGADPASPSPVPQPVRRPPGAVPLATGRPAMARPSRARRFLVPVRAHASLSDPVSTPPRGGDLTLPAQLRDVLGVDAVGTLTMRRGTAY